MMTTSYRSSAFTPALVAGEQSRVQARVRTRQSQRGISLIELMIAMVISLMTVLAITALISSQARQQRLGGSTNDTQSSAMLAISMLEKDLQQAGVGMAGNSLQNCARFLTSINTGTGAAALDNFDTAAVSIVNGAGTGPDTIRIRYAESVRGEQPLPLTADMGNTIDNIRVSSNSSYGLRAK